MKDPRGTIVDIVRDSRGVTAVVDVDAETVCARCASGRGCGAGIFAAREGRRRLDIAIGEGLDLGKGDVVDVRLAPQNVLGAALLVYGLPLTGAALAAAGAFVFGLGDAAAAVAALGGLAAGILVGRWRLRDDACLSRFTPTISRRVATDL